MTNKAALFFVALVILAGIGLAACQSQNANQVSNTGNPTQAPPSTAVVATIPPPTAVPSPTPAPSEAEIKDGIIKALLALTGRANRMDNTTVLEDGKISRNVIEYVPPDRKHIINVDDAVEYIVVGEKVYAKMKTSAWEETQIPAATFMGEGKNAEQSLRESIRNAQFVRKDDLDGKPVIVYRYDSQSNSNGVDLNSQVELWVGEADGLPYKMVIDGEILSATTDPASGESKLQAVKALTTTLFEFDPAINIQPPVQ